MKITVLKDLRMMFGEARDQGSRPTCVAFAASDTHAFVRSKPFEFLSAEYLYYHAVHTNSPPPLPTKGVSLQNVITALASPGQPVEKQWPYLSELPAKLSLWSPPLSVETYRTTLATTSTSSHSVVASLQQDIPLVLTMSITQAFFNPDANGCVVPQPGDTITGYHAVIAVGLGSLNTSRCFLIRNSWGKDWGLDGYGWLPENYLTSNLKNVAIIP